MIAGLKLFSQRRHAAQLQNFRDRTQRKYHETWTRSSCRWVMRECLPEWARFTLLQHRVNIRALILATCHTRICKLRRICAMTVANYFNPMCRHTILSLMTVTTSRLATFSFFQSKQKSEEMLPRVSREKWGNGQCRLFWLSCSVSISGPKCWRYHRWSLELVPSKLPIPQLWDQGTRWSSAYLSYFVHIWVLGKACQVASARWRRQTA
jgi:hypothetical protein